MDIHMQHVMQQTWLFNEDVVWLVGMLLGKLMLSGGHSLNKILVSNHGQLRCSGVFVLPRMPFWGYLVTIYIM